MQVIDFQIAQGESQTAWEGFLTSLYRRGLTEEGVACLMADEEQLLSFFQIKDSKLWPQIRTTNAIPFFPDTKYLTLPPPFPLDARDFQCQSQNFFEGGKRRLVRVVCLVGLAIVARKRG